MRSRPWPAAGLVGLTLLRCGSDEGSDPPAEEAPALRPAAYVEPQDLLAPPDSTTAPEPTAEMVAEPVVEPVAPPPPLPVEPEAIPPNPNVHPGWSRAAVSCAGEGLPCGQCDDTTICFFGDPAACVPRADNDGLTCGAGALAPCDPSRPHCINQVCMTLAEANCFCTAQPGDTAAACEQDPNAPGP